MHTMGEERDMFAGLGWEKEIRSLRDPHVLFNPSPEHDIGAGNQYSDDYELIPFSQSTQAWRWRMHKEQKQYTKNKKRRADVLDKDATRCMNSEADDAIDLNEKKSNDRQKEVKVVGESSRSFSFRERMKGLSLHRRPLKERMRDKTVSYIDLLWPGPPPSRRNDKMKSEASRKLVIRK
jgi:hypothetical protein